LIFNEYTEEKELEKEKGMDPLDIAILFNGQLGDLILKMKDMYPADPDFGTFHRFCQLFFSAAKRKPIEIFAACVAEPFRVPLQSRDDAFFIQKDFQTDLASTVGGVLDEKEQFILIPKMKQYWTSMTPDSRKSMWDYCDLLLRLSDTYAAQTKKA
jgi:hypothetical protein